MRSIRKRLIGNYITIALVTVLILEGLSAIAISEYYIGGVERILANQAETSATFFNRYADAGDIYKKSNYIFENLNAESVNKVAPAAQKCVGTTMMIYPVSAGIAYLTLAEATGDEMYFHAALRIAEYYKKNVLPCGSWYLLYDCASGKPLSENVCLDFRFVNFFQML